MTPKIIEQIKRNKNLLIICPELYNLFSFEVTLDSVINKDNKLKNAVKKALKPKQEEQPRNSPIRKRVWEWIAQGGAESSYIAKYREEEGRKYMPTHYRRQWRQYYPEYIRIKKRNIFVTFS